MPPDPVCLDVLAPLSGLVVPLESVPDPVFAQKMAGDGLSLDPTSGEVLAPVSGVVSQLHPSGHAVAVAMGGAAAGVEVLVHVGLDTVLLKGRGFTPRVAKGEAVRAGQPLLSFDPDLVAREAKSLLTEIVVPEGGRVLDPARAGSLVVAGRDVLFRLKLPAGAQVPSEAASEEGAAAMSAPGQSAPDFSVPDGSVLSRPVALPNPAGMHARPAAVLAAQAKRYSADVRLVLGDREANAKSMVAVLALSLAHGDTVRVKAAGADAALAAEALADLLAQGCGEDPAEAPVQSDQVQPGPAGSSPPPSAAAASAPASPEPGLFAGIAASPGLALGPVVRYLAREPEVAEEGQGPERELARLETALAQARGQIEALKHQPGDAGRGRILDAHLELLDDPELTGQAKAGLSAGRSAAFAWREAFRAQAAVLEGLDNALLRERAGDLRDVGRRVLSLLAKGGRAMPEFSGQAVLVAEELVPSEAAALDRSKILGFATCRGGATGHVAILARSMGLPAVCGLDRAVLDLPEGAQALLDGDRGTLRLDPGPQEIAEARRRMAEMAERRERELAAASALAHTADGHRVEVAANVVTADDARQAMESGGEGVGLLRSEFLFEDRESAPDEEEQAAAYLAVARVLGPGRRLVIRTMDVGGDKPLSYLPLPREDNPFLGLRGLRVSLDRPDLLRTQLRAILRCAGESDLHLMFPMVASLDELRAARAHVAEVQAELGVSAKVGVMIEVPSAAILAEALAPEADFFSIGSNDLTQYTLAMDRGHPRLAKQADALHPAVLRLIGMTCEAAHRHGKWTGVCGGLASDLAAVPVLVGLGVDELSVAVPSIPAVKAAVARRPLEECRTLAREVCALATSGEVRARLAALAH